MPTRSSIVIACLAVTLLAACSTSTKTSGSPSITPATAAQLNAMLLQASDLPSGWTAAAATPESSNSSSDAAFASCVGIRNTDPDKVAEGDSPDFSMGNATISSSANSFRSGADIQTDVSALSSPKVDACFKAQLQAGFASSLPSGAKVDSFSVSVTPGAGSGPSNVAGTATCTIAVTDSGQNATAYLGVAFITGPQIEAEIDFENVGQPVATDLQAALVKAVADRIAAG